MKSSVKASKSIILGLAILSLSACGKNMHIPVGNEPSVKQADSIVMKDDKKSVPPAAEAAGFVSEKLTALSKWDVANLLHNVTKQVRHLGDSSDASEDGTIKINQNVTLESRALILVPAAKDIKAITAFTLTLKGFNIVVPKADANAKKEDAVQERVCIGQDEKTCLDISEKAEKALGSLEDGSVIKGSEKEIKLDLITEFGIAKENASADEVKVSVLKWLADNSLEFSSTGYRKVRVRLMSNSNISEGTLMLQTELADAKSVSLVSVPSVADLKNGADDLVSAEALSKTNVVKVSEVTEESAEEASHKAADEKKAADEQKVIDQKEAAQKVEDEHKAAEKLKADQEAQVKKDAEKKAEEVKAATPANVDQAQNAAAVQAAEAPAQAPAHETVSN